MLKACTKNSIKVFMSICIHAFMSVFCFHRENMIIVSLLCTIPLIDIIWNGCLCSINERGSSREVS